MKYRKLGNTGLTVSRLGMGSLTIAEDQLDLSLEKGAEVIRYAMEKGVNFFDTAQGYDTYRYFGEVFKDCDKSNRPVVSTKSRATTYEEMEESVYKALRELHLEYIDIFLIHEVRHDPDFESRSGAWRCLRDYKAKGLIKAIGVSTHHIDVVEKMADTPECDVVFPLVNYAGLGIRKGESAGSAEEMVKAINRCAASGKGLYAMKAFGGGHLTRECVKALKFVDGIDGISSAMLGMGTKKEIDEAVAFFDGELGDEFQPDVKNKKVHISGCEGCGTCIDACPNKAIFRGEDGKAQLDHDVCLTCGYCAPVCPVRAIVLW